MARSAYADIKHEKFIRLFETCSKELAEEMKKRINYLNETNIFEVYGKKPSPREMEILIWFLRGKAALETSIILGISKKTVQNLYDRIKN